MFDIKEQDVLGQTNKLLFNIWNELRSTAQIGGIPLTISKMKSVTTTNATGLVTLCPYCGKDHKQKGVAGVCARKRKAAIKNG